MPALCHRIHKSKVNPAQYGGQVDINLVGIAIGNGWMSPIEQGKYASYLYYHGLLDGDQYLTLLELEDGLIAKVMSNPYQRNQKVLKDGKLWCLLFSRNC